MTVKRNKIDLLSAFQPRQKAIVSSLVTASAQANLAAGDVIGFTFFIGYMAMFAATVFFFFERLF